MIHGKTDRKPFKKLSYCEFDCNWESDQNEMNVSTERQEIAKSGSAARVKVIEFLERSREYYNVLLFKLVSALFTRNSKSAPI